MNLICDRTFVIPLFVYKSNKHARIITNLDVEENVSRGLEEKGGVDEKGKKRYRLTNDFRCLNAYYGPGGTVQANMWDKLNQLSPKWKVYAKVDVCVMLSSHLR